MSQHLPPGTKVRVVTGTQHLFKVVGLSGYYYRRYLGQVGEVMAQAANPWDDTPVETVRVRFPGPLGLWSSGADHFHDWYLPVAALVVLPKVFWVEEGEA